MMGGLGIQQEKITVALALSDLHKAPFVVT
jgi:hypothetical protein